MAQSASSFPPSVGEAAIAQPMETTKDVKKPRAPRKAATKKAAEDKPAESSSDSE